MLSPIELGLTTLCSYSLKSHPNKLLIDHLKKVGELSQEIVNSKSLAEKSIIAKIAYLIGITHDCGKATTYFQELLNKNVKSRYAYHGLLSSLLAYQVVKDYLTTIGKLQEFRWFPVMTWVAVKKHHGNIQNLRGEDKAEITALRKLSERDLVTKQIENILTVNREEVLHIFAKTLGHSNILIFFEKIRQWDALTKEIRNEARGLSLDAKLENYLTMLFLYSVLLDADKMDASGTDSPSRITKIQEDLVDRYREETFTEKADAFGVIREKAYHETIKSVAWIDISKDRLLSINLPTGIGKTLSGFSFSLKLRDRVSKELGFMPRIIYCLPFLSIIDQNGDVISKVLQKQFAEVPTNVFLKHHHLADVRYIELKDEQLYQIEEIEKALLLTEAWDSEIIITTFVQFFHSLITNQNRAARKLHNMANSIIILDEVQAIPSKYWLLINQMLELLAFKFNCWIVLMTATQPLIFRPDQMRELITDKAQYFNSLDRVEFLPSLDNEGKFVYQSIEQFKEIIFKQIVEKSDKDIMIVVNTINLCQQLYEFLKHRLSNDSIQKANRIDDDGICNLGTMELINLSTRVLPADRLRRIDRIRNDHCRKVIVTTQLIEAGVDISADIVYRDLAPLDCIVQTAGRCNRNNKDRKGLLIVTPLKDENERPFHHFVYDDALVDATKQVLEGLGSRFSERELTGAIHDYYNIIQQRSNINESTALIESLKKLDLSESKRFELIEDTDDTISIFIEEGDKAINIRENIQNILREDNSGFTKKAKITALKKGINEHTINVRFSHRLESIKNLPLLFGEDFRYVPRDQIETWYKKDIGLIIPEDKTSSKSI